MNKKIISLILSVLMLLPLAAFVSADTNEPEYLFFDSFEDIETGKAPTGDNWTVYVATEDSVVTEGDASDGKKALICYDPSTEIGYGYRTKLVPVTAGSYYYAAADFSVEEGAAQLYIEYWDSTGKNRLTPVTILSTYSSSWETLEETTQAPEGSAYMTILLYQHVGNTGIARYDNVKITKGNESDASPSNPGTGSSDGYYDPKKEIKNIADGYPRLYFKKSEKEAFIAKKDDDTKNYAGASAFSTANAVISTAETYLNEKSITCSYYDNYTVTYEYPLKQPGKMSNPPTYTAGGVYPYWTALGGQIRERLKYLSTAYLLTGDEKYAEFCTQYLLWLCEWNSWSDPYYGNGNACLDSGYITNGVCTAYDFLYDYFTDEQREKIKKSIYEKALKRPLKAWGFDADHNVQVVITSGIAMAACTLLGEYDEASDAINKAISYFQWYLDRRMNTNTHEGNMYTALSLENIMAAADCILNTTGDRSVFDHPYISEFLFKWMIAGGDSSTGRFAEISDGSSSVGFFATASILNKATGNLYAGYFLKRARVYSNSLEGLLYGLIEPKYEIPSQDLQSVYLKEIGWGSMRTGWGAGDTTLVFTSSLSDLGHNHYDNNSFVIMRDGLVLASDPGYQDYSPGDKQNYTLKDGHSTIYVDGKSQNAKGLSTIEEKLTSGFFSYMIGSAAKSYRSPKLSKFDRSFIMINHESYPYFVLKDDIEAPAEHTYTWRLNVTTAAYTRIEGETSKVGIASSGTWFECDYNTLKMLVCFASENPLSMTWNRYKTTTGLILDASNGVKSKTDDYLAVISTRTPGSNTINFINYFDQLTKSSEDVAVSKNSIDGNQIVYFKPTEVGQFITLPLNVGITDSYKVTFKMSTARSYGMCDIYLDDVLIGSVNEYKDDYLDAAKFDLGLFDIKAGEHVLKFVAKGSPVDSDKFNIGVISAVLESTDPNAGKVTVAENVDNENARGCVVAYGGSNAKKDIILFAKGSGIDTNLVKSDGSYATILGTADGKMTAGYIVIGGKNLSYDGKLLFESPMAANAAITFESEEGSVIKMSASGKVKLYIPEKEVIGKEIIGLKVGGAETDLALDGDRFLTLTVPKGETYVDFIFKNVEAGNDPADPSDPSNPGDPSDPAASPNNVVIFVIIGVVALAAIIGIVAFLLKKKKA